MIIDVYKRKVRFGVAIEVSDDNAVRIIPYVVRSRRRLKCAVAVAREHGDLAGEEITNGQVRLAITIESNDGSVISDQNTIPLTALREASDSFFRDWMEA